ncbi:peptidase domain-containing ABC transporter [Streptomyces sp. GESEQ-35]|uniref:peptidase domain-containing ABC transporter n=1 Tax=Streptomyces sp. GESEQ-35 TaxID=2812657 RepID=UPI001B330E46|nr:ABC transporter transmembrane domain-containing protein [Streptomyces sp. GESEQ-35]
MKWQRYHAHQEGDTDCGPACVRILLRRHGILVDTAVLRESVGLGASGASLLRLRDVLAGYGVESLLLRPGPDEVLTVLGAAGPSIAVLYEEGLYHFVVVHEVRAGGTLLISDPARYRPTTVAIEDFMARFSGQVLVTEIPSGGGAGLRHVLREVRSQSILWRIAAERRGRLLAIGLLTAATSALLIGASTLFFQVAVDTYLPRGDVSGIAVAALAAVLVVLGGAVLQYVRGRLVITLGQSLQRQLTQAYTRKLMRLPLSFYATRRTGDLVSRFGDVQAIQALLATLTVGAAVDVCTVVISGAYLAYAAPALFLILLLSAAVDVGTSWALYPAVREQAEEALQRDSSLKAEAYNLLRGHLELAAQGRRAYAAERLDRALGRLVDAETRLGRLDNLSGTVKIANQGVFVIVVAWLGTVQVGGGSLAMGQLMSFLALSGYFLASAENLAVLQVRVQRATAALGRYRDVMSQREDPRAEAARPDGARAEALTSGGQLRAEALSFAYSSAHDEVFGGLSFTVPEQGRALVRGPNGAGKSTLLKVLAGLHPGYAGTVTIGGTDISDLDEIERARHVLYVPEEPLILAATVRENLTLGAHHPQEDVDLACRAACFDDVVNTLPDGYDAVLKEDGGQLSRGQAQRLAVARALLRAPEVYLFDETFSGIDEDTFHRVWKNLRDRPGAKVLVSHREVPETDFDTTVVVRK